jgi:nicotinamide-nucleotide amidase
MFPSAMLDEAVRLLDAFRARRFRLATAESCSGGLIAALLTEIPRRLRRGRARFSSPTPTRPSRNASGSPRPLLEAHGAISQAVARAMRRAHWRIRTRMSPSPSLGLPDPAAAARAKPVGLVHLAAARTGGPTLHQECRFGDIGRDLVRVKSVEVALALLWRALQA